MDLATAEAAFDAASTTYSAALKAFQRSRSVKNHVALDAASETFEAALAALQLLRDAEAREALRARRLACVAPRRALNACQMELPLCSA